MSNNEILNFSTENSQELKLSPQQEKGFQDFLKKKEIEESKTYSIEERKKLKEDYLKNENLQNIEDNTSKKENNNLELKEVGEKIGTLDNKDLNKKIGDLSNITELNQGIKNNIKNDILGDEKLIGTLGGLASLPIIGNLIKIFLNFFNIDSKNIETSNKLDNKELEIIKSQIIGKGSFLEGLKIGEDFGKANGDFIDNIKLIANNKLKENLNSDLEKLFKKGGDFESFINVPEIKKDIPLTNINGEIIYKNLEGFIISYKNFLIKKEENPSYKIEDFINDEKKASEKFSFNDNKNTIGTTNKKTENNNIESFIVSGNENLEISQNGIDFIFDKDGVKYQVLLNSKGEIQITGNGQRAIYSGAEKIFEELIKFNGILDKKATGGDFGKTGFKASVELNGKSIKDILINGLNEKVSIGPFSEQVNEAGLKQIISEKFLNSGNLLKNNIVITFQGKTNTLNFQNLA